MADNKWTSDVTRVAVAQCVAALASCIVVSLLVLPPISVRWHAVGGIPNLTLSESCTGRGPLL